MWFVAVVLFLFIPATVAVFLGPDAGAFVIVIFALILGVMMSNPQPKEKNRE